MRAFNACREYVPSERSTLGTASERVLVSLVHSAKRSAPTTPQTTQSAPPPRLLAAANKRPSGVRHLSAQEPLLNSVEVRRLAGVLRRWAESRDETRRSEYPIYRTGLSCMAGRSVVRLSHRAQSGFITARDIMYSYLQITRFLG